MAGMTARIARHRIQPFTPRAIPRIIHQSPGAVERRRAKIITIPGHDIAGSVANGAADAFNAGISLLPRLAAGGDHGKFIRHGAIRRVLWLKKPLRTLPLVEERRQISRQVADHRQIGQGAQFQRTICARHFPHMRPAGPARAAIHCHGAGPAHANPASEAIGKAWVKLSLDMCYHIQHGLIVARRHVITREAARFLSPPDTDLELFHERQTKATGQPVQPMACCLKQEEAGMEQRGADILVAALKQAGVSRIFTLSGNHIMTIFDALIGSGIEIVHTRQEAAAVHMADAWARLTGEVGVAMVTGGQGHTNAIAALPTAMAGEVPVLLLSGHAPLRELGLGTFQELRQADMAEPVTKLSFTASSTAGIGADVARAFRVARSGRPGPVHLSLPTDLMDARIPAPTVPDAAAFGAEAMPLGATTAQAMAAMIADAARPIILAPPALCSPRGKPLMAALSAAAGLPVIPMESPRGLNDPSLGAYAGVLAEADLVVLIGKGLDFSLRFGRAPGISAKARFIQIDPDAGIIARGARALPGRIALAAVASAAEATEALTRAMQPHATQAWAERISTALAFRPPAWADLAGATGGPIHPATLFQAAKPFLDQSTDSVLISDGGEIGQWAQAILAAPTRIINGLAGAIGPSIPFAMAARAAKPDARIMAVLGDGTFGFHMAEFDTACRHKLPFVAIVGNDSRWNAEYEIQKRDYGANRTHGCELAPGTRYDLVAVALGGHGEYVTKAEEIAPALERAFASGKPACVNVVIEGQLAPNIRMG